MERKDDWIIIYPQKKGKGEKKNRERILFFSLFSLYQIIMGTQKVELQLRLDRHHFQIARNFLSSPIRHIHWH